MGGGSFVNPQSIAADAEGDVYVYDAGAEGGSIYKFDASGKPVNSFALGTTNVITNVGFKSSDEQELAVSSAGPAKGDIFIANGHLVGIYDTTGNKIGELTEPGGGHPWGEPCGVAVDPAGNVYVGLENGSTTSAVNKYVPTASMPTNANYNSSIWRGQTICNVAADTEGVYADTWNRGPVNKYPMSVFSAIEPPPLSEEEHVEVDNAGSTLAVNASTHHVFVDEQSDVAEYEGASPFTRLEETTGLSGSFGVAAAGEGAGERLYAATTSPTPTVGIYGPAVAEPTELIDESASDVASTSATLIARVNPKGNPTTYYFQYGTTAAYEASSPSPPGNTLATSEEPLAAPAHLQGLSPGTVYHYRVVVLSEVEGHPRRLEGPDQTFTTQQPGGEFLLPDGRQFEMVTPPKKLGALFVPLSPPNLPPERRTTHFVQASVGGDAIAIEATAPSEAEPQGNGDIAVQVLSTRGSPDWSAQTIAPPHLAAGPSGQGAPEYWLFFAGSLTWRRAACCRRLRAALAAGDRIDGVPPHQLCQRRCQRTLQFPLHEPRVLLPATRHRRQRHSGAVPTLRRSCT